MMTRFTIPDMDCDGCIASITRAVQKLDAGASVRADLATHVVEIASSAPQAELKAAIDAAGYTVQAA
jgi:copper chaperone